MSGASPYRGAAWSVHRCCRVDAAQKADLLSWTDGMLVAFELAAKSADVVVIRPCEQHAIIEHLQEHAAAGAAILTIEYPPLKLPGSSHRRRLG